MEARRLLVAVWVLCCLAQLHSAEGSEVQALEAADAGRVGKVDAIARDALSRRAAKEAIETAERKEALKSTMRSYEVVFGKKKESDPLAKSKKGKVAADLASMVKNYVIATGRAVRVGKVGDKAPTGGKGTRMVRSMKRLQTIMMGGKKKYAKFDSKNEDKQVTSTGPLTSKQYMKEVADAQKDYDFGIKGIPQVNKKAGTATIKRGATPGSAQRSMALKQRQKKLQKRKAKKSSTLLTNRLNKKPSVFALLETEEANPHVPSTASLQPRKKSYGTKKTVRTGKTSIAKTHSLFAQAEKANAAAKAAGVEPPNSMSAIKELETPPRPPKHFKPRPKVVKKVVKHEPPKPVREPPKPVKAPPVKKKVVKKKAVKKKPKKLAGSHQAWHTMMHQRADAIEKGIKAMKERKAKAKARPPPRPAKPQVKAPRVKKTKAKKPKLSKLDRLKKQAKELQIKATASRHLAYKLQREAAVSVGAPQQKADWDAEQEKTVAGFMQTQADEARGALIRFLSKKKGKALRKKRRLIKKRKIRKAAKKVEKKAEKKKAKKEKKKMVKKAVKAAKKKVVKMKKVAAKKKKKALKKKMKAKAKKAKKKAKAKVKKAKKKAAKKKLKKAQAALKAKTKAAPHKYGHSSVLKYANSAPTSKAKQQIKRRVAAIKKIHP